MIPLSFHNEIQIPWHDHKALRDMSYIFILISGHYFLSPIVCHAASRPLANNDAVPTAWNALPLLLSSRLVASYS